MSTRSNPARGKTTDTPASNQEQPGATRSARAPAPARSQKSAGVDALIEAIEANAYGELLPAIDARAKYARVYEPTHMRGFYRIDGYKTAILADCFPRVIRKIIPHVSSKRAFSRLFVEFTARDGRVKELEVTRESLLDGSVASKLAGIASLPEQEVQVRYLVEALQKISRLEGVQVQEDTDTLGWYEQENGSLIWNMVNGCETLAGFISQEGAPYLAPDIPSTGNGYYGSDETPALPLAQDEDALYALLVEYAPHRDIDAMGAGLLGCAGALMLPADIVPETLALHDGTLRFTPEIIGESRHGKSRFSNALLSLFGTRFLWDTHPLLSIEGKGDTFNGRLHLMAPMKHHLYADADYKAAPGTSDFDKQYALRKELINIFADGAGGGTTSSRRGVARARDIPHGGCFRTCNHEYAPYAIEQQEDMIEKRSCTFIWPTGIRGSDERSRFIDKNRKSIYAIGQAFRKWMMSRYASDKRGLRELAEGVYELARLLAGDSDYTWCSDQHRNQCEVMVFGLLIWQEFLTETLPGYFLHSWIDEHIIPLIENRVQRSAAIQEMIEAYQEQTNVEHFAINTIRYLLASHQCYIRSQRDNTLSEQEIDGLPFTLEDVGYRSVTRLDTGESFEPMGAQKIGYLVHKGQDIAFLPGSLVEALRREASRKHLTLPSKSQIEETLLKAGALLPQFDKADKFVTHEQQIKIAGRNARYLVIPVSVLFAGVEVLEEQEAEEQEAASLRPQFPCTQCKSKLWVHRIDGERVIWHCARCKQPYTQALRQYAQADETGAIPDFCMSPDEVEEVEMWENAGAGTRNVSAPIVS